MLSWYVIRVHAKREFSACTMLERRGFSVVLPVEHKWRKASRHTKRKTLHSYPMLQGYLFVGVDGDLPWWELRELPFLVGYIGSAYGVPYALSRADLERMISISAVAVPYTNAPNPHKAIRPGDDAVIVNGPLAGRTIKVDSIVGQKAWFAQEILGSQHRVEIPLRMLEAA